MKSILTIAALFSCALLIGQSKVGINTDSPQFNLDIRGLDDVTDGADLQLATPSQNHFLRLFGGRDGDPKPFLLFSNLDTFRIATSGSDYSDFTDRLTVFPNGRIGMGTTFPLNRLHIHEDSTFALPPPFDGLYGNPIALQITNGVSGDSATAGLIAGVTSGGTGRIASPANLQVSLSDAIAKLHLFGNVISVDSNLWVSGNINMSSLADTADLNLAIGPDGNLKTSPMVVADSDWTEGGGFVYNLSNWVGIGTDTPEGNLMIEGVENNGFESALIVQSEPLPGKYNRMFIDGDEIDVFASPGTSDQLTLQGNTSGNIRMVGGGGLVGIGGPPVAGRKLHVRGKDIIPGQDLFNSPATICISSDEVSAEMLIDGDAIETVNNNLHLNQYSYFDVILANGGGHVGIGPSSPYGRLTVHGPDNDGTFGALRVVQYGGSAEMLMDGDEIDVVYGNGLHLNANSKKPVTIGTNTIAAGFALSVKGRIMTDEVQVQLIDTWPDYVFADDYPLMPLEEVERSIAENNHLPGIPSAQEVEENGIALGDMQRRLLEKVEELTLHMIEMNKRIDELEKENRHLRQECAEIKEQPKN